MDDFRSRNDRFGRSCARNREGMQFSRIENARDRELRCSTTSGGRRPPRVRRKRLLIFTIMRRARSGSIREKSPERKNSRCLAKPRRTRLSHDIYFAERLVCKTPRKSPCRRCRARFAGTCPRSAFRLFGAPLSSDMHMHAVTINIFIARGMGRTRGIQRGRFATPKTYNLYLYVRYKCDERLLPNGC